MPGHIEMAKTIINKIGSARLCLSFNRHHVTREAGEDKGAMFTRISDSCEFDTEPEPARFDR